MTSKRRQRRRSCEGKRHYRTQAEAVAAIIGMQKQTDGMHGYKCQFGNHWHIGHRTKGTWKAMQDRGTDP
jgi:hypothetical protein